MWSNPHGPKPMIGRLHQTFNLTDNKVPQRHNLPNARLPAQEPVFVSVSLIKLNITLPYCSPTSLLLHSWYLGWKPHFQTSAAQMACDARCRTGGTQSG